MSLIHGRDVTAEEIERILGQDSVQRFTSLCNAIAWEVSRPLRLTHVVFTERVYVADNGVDAELLVEIPEVLEPAAILVPGRNILQYKLRDAAARGRARTVAELVRNVAGAIRDASDRTGQPIQHYLLFTNLHLSVEEHGRLLNALRADVDETTVRILGAGELAAVLNNLPHLRSAYFATADFVSWQKSWENHNTATLSARVPPFTGRAGLLTATRTAVDDADTKVLILAGPPGIGKTRLALEATRHKPFDTVASVNGGSVTIPDLLALVSPRRQPVVMVDIPDENLAEGLVSTALTEQIKLVITVSSPEIFNAVNFGRDNRVRMFSVVPLNEEESSSLLRATDIRLDYGVSSWISESAGGNPGVLLAAAHVGDQLRMQVPNFSNQVGRALEIRARTTLGVEGLRKLGFLSVLTAVGFSGDAQSELDCLTRILGADDPRVIVGEARTMAALGFLQVRGSYLEVIPPIFANYLAEVTLARRPNDVAALFVALPPGARGRLLRRLSRLPGNAIQEFWRELLRTGPLSTFERALAEVQLLKLVAAAMPIQISQLVLDGLSRLTLPQRREITGNTRRELVWTIDQLLFRSQSVRPALASLALLAEAENEEWSNNATGIFAECFHPGHPQIPLTVDERFTILNDFLRGEETQSRKLLVVKASDAAFRRTGSVILRRADGGQPLDSAPPMTHRQIRQYLRRLIELQRQLLEDADREVSQAAGQALITAIGEYTIQADPAHGVEMLEELRDRVVDNLFPIRLDRYVTTLSLAIRGVPQDEQFRAVHARLQALSESLDGADFGVRIRRWIGSWDLGWEKVEFEGAQVYRGELEIRRLAEAAAANPRLVSAGSLAWLNSFEAKRSPEFFYAIGLNDNAALWQEIVEETGTHETGTRNFAAYFSGRGVSSADRVEQRLDDLALAGRVQGPALVAATGFLPGSARAVRRAVALINRGSVTPEFVERQLMAGGWMNPLRAEETIELLTAVAGHDFERAALVIDFLSMWVHTNKAFDDPLREIAWLALERTPTSGEAWDFDIVAAAIADSDHARAFRLFERYLVLPNEQRSWQPLDRHGGNRFWQLLWQFDSRRCIELLRETGSGSQVAAWRIRWHLPEILDLARDRAILFQFAQESEANAELIASWLASKDGFWPLAVDILATHPANQRVQQSIQMAAEHMNRSVWGESSANNAAWAAEVDAVLARPETPAVVRPFLLTLANNFRRQSEDDLRAEQDGRINW